MDLKLAVRAARASFGVVMRVFVVTALFNTALQCSASTPDADCIDWTQRILDERDDACSDLCPQAKKFDK